VLGQLTTSRESAQDTRFDCDRSGRTGYPCIVGIVREHISEFSTHYLEAHQLQLIPSNPMTSENIEIIRKIYEAFSHQDRQPVLTDDFDGDIVPMPDCMNLR
jgi:hypothetical protein